MKETIARRAYTASRIDDLRLNLSETENLIKGRACVYATGSFGRKEASSHSDLDLFIVGNTTEGKDGQRDSMLSFLSEILVSPI
jgi:UTP:GlnB (protein PII) uridylyltransferase